MSARVLHIYWVSMSCSPESLSEVQSVRSCSYSNTIRSIEIEKQVIRFYFFLIFEWTDINTRHSLRTTTSSFECRVSPVQNHSTPPAAGLRFIELRPPAPCSPSSQRAAFVPCLIYNILAFRKRVVDGLLITHYTDTFCSCACSHLLPITSR